MSYDVTSWTTKSLVNLRIPVASLYKHAREDWHPEREDYPDGTVTFSFIDETYIEGKIEGEFVAVTDVNAQGEGSGTALNWIIEPALKDSTGELVAVRVWEGGDQIDRLTVVDGTVSEETIEL